MTRNLEELEGDLKHIRYLIEQLEKKIAKNSKTKSFDLFFPSNIKSRNYSFPSESLKNHVIPDTEKNTKKSREDRDKQRLVGNLPFVLLDKKYFPTNDLLVKFAQKNLKLRLKFPKSKSRDALIGSIIVEVVKKDPIEIRMFYRAIEEIIGRNEVVGVNDFFGEWNKIIRTL